MGFAYKQDIKWSAQHKTSAGITPMQGSAVDKVKTLEAYYFTMNELGQEFGWDRAVDNGGVVPRRIGLISQELQAVEPSLVRVMDWLDTEEDYYWIDYEALNGLLLEAIKELNQRADAVKTQLGMSVDTYPTPAETTSFSPNVTVQSLTVDPVNGEEGNVSTWTLTVDGAYPGLKIPFGLFGDVTWDDLDVSLDEEGYPSSMLVKPDVNSEGAQAVNYDPSVDGFARGIFAFDGTQNWCQVRIAYKLDNMTEPTETLTMKLMTPDSYGNPVNQLTASATISDPS